MLKGRARKWLEQLEMLVRNQYLLQGSPPLPEPHALHIAVVHPQQRGRRLDAHNLVDLVADYVAAGLDIDDQSFSVYAESSDRRAGRGNVVITFTAGGANE